MSPTMKSVRVQFQGLSGMFSERESEIKELQDQLEDFVAELGLGDGSASSPTRGPDSHSLDSSCRTLAPGELSSPQPFVASINGQAAVSDAFGALQDYSSQTPHQHPSRPTPRQVAHESHEDDFGLPQAKDSVSSDMLLPLPAPQGPTPRTVVMSPRDAADDFGISPASASVPSKMDEVGSTSQEWESPPPPSQGLDVTTQIVSRVAKESNSSSVPRAVPQRYAALDQKIESLLGALGALDGQAKLPASNESFEVAIRNVKAAPDKKIEALQQKTQELFG